MMQSRLHTLLCAAILSVGSALIPAHAADAPGKGVKVQPLQSSNAEESFQTLLVARALQKLGYEVAPAKEIEYATAHVAIANGDASFMAAHWSPLHDDFYKNSGGEAKLLRQGTYSTQAAQGYLIDRKTAEQYKITRIDQLKDPKLARLFDATGDGKADLTGCNPGWGCEAVIEHQIEKFGLKNTVSHVQGSYAALMADTIARFKKGQPILYYTWTPYWVSGVLRPGQEVVWLEVPFSSLPGAQAKLDTKLPNGKNFGFVLNNQHILVNKAFAEKNPVAARLFTVMQLPVGDINAQNLRMRQGEDKPADIERHVDGWIKAHQKTFDGWLEAAAKTVK